MDGGVNMVGFSANKFQDIDLTSGRPAFFGKIIAEHPEGGPNALPIRKFYPCFDAPILPGMQPLCLDARRGVIATGDQLRLLTCFDHEHSFLYADVFWSIGICLPFLVSPAATPNVERPVRQVQFSAIEFIMPCNDPARAI